MTTLLGRKTTPKDATIVETDKITIMAFASTSKALHPLPIHRNKTTTNTLGVRYLGQGHVIDTLELHKEPWSAMPTTI